MIDSNLDKLIDLITQKVTEKLEQQGIKKEFSKSLVQEVSGETTRQYGLTTLKSRNYSEKTPHRPYSYKTQDAPANAQKIPSNMASMIDHTLLKPDATKSQLKTLCEEAIQYQFATCCVNSANIPYCAELLKGTNVKPIAVIGFPLGAASTQSKVFETQEAIKNGAKEIDMVINIGALKSKDYKNVYEDIRAVVQAANPYPVKVILETGNLSEDEKIIACALSKTAEALFVKTSTGFGKGGATVDDIKLMRRIVGSNMKVKASGGIRTTDDALAMINAGADRIGASASIAIVTGKKETSKGY